MNQVDPFDGAVHVVVDLETLGRGPRAKLVSLGAVRFAMDGGRMVGRQDFYRLIASDGTNAERPEDAATVEWWAKQDWQARCALSVGPRYALGQALAEFGDWACGNLDADAAARVLMAWGFGDEFDLAILQDAVDQECRACADPQSAPFGLSLPWSFRRQENLRTLAHCFPHVPRPAHIGVKHNALHDARHEAVWLAALLTERERWLDVAAIANQTFDTPALYAAGSIHPLQ